MWRGFSTNFLAYVKWEGVVSAFWGIFWGIWGKGSLCWGNN